MEQIEETGRRLDLGGIVGLGALAIGFAAEAVRLIGIDLGWFGDGDALERALLVVWMVGLVVFGLAFFGLWLLGRTLGPEERVALSDELRQLLGQRSAVMAFLVSYVVAVLLASIPAFADLPGRSVALLIAAAGSGVLAMGNLRAFRS